ncbi:MAG: rhodanese-like domain-containing protein [Burkholderiaceae bacterium]|jgi:rhodanese-related sulfurtransferase|uniref:Rhodanese-like domain-containing protein n=1 Tax=Cupriavidus metallidurans TaxID=119219 RepID=A0A482ISX2_9BURK|nr:MULTISPECIES: rhodanese-like domain-containing protein [Cupriavidus]KWR81932.1 sulfurtransferase [Cupriavidus sp. SHE]PCH55651.1 MAG: rhodanese-like domain-containing protein [Burkholderiaceae bacterium]QBP10239.1 rhodanese-like domain-containing protein [Cupriavidus metallidurans]QWC87313.1 rhodanese-like domain-containing protein [Cupriavidus metallidurans]
MTTRDELLQAAQTRKQQGELAYYGALTPQEAYALLRAEPKAVLVDVRTQAELDWVGGVDLPDEQFAHIEWMSYPGGAQNANFVAELKARVPADAPVLFLCRSAARSKHAARVATENGYLLAMDVLEGFEGNRDDHHHRKTVEGWCVRGLPWHGA